MNTRKSVMRQGAVRCAVCAALLLGAALPLCAQSVKPVSLNEAIRLTAVSIAERFPQGRLVAVEHFNAPSPALSRYIMEELTGHLVRGKVITALDRKNIESFERELMFQESGKVSEETQKQIGRMMGAESLVTGTLEKHGRDWRWHGTMSGVEGAGYEADVSFVIKGGREFDTLHAALQSGKQKADTAYREQELLRVPRTAADYMNRGLMFALRGDFDIAVDDFTDAIKLNPNLAVAYVQRGKALIARRLPKQNRYSLDGEFTFAWVFNTLDTGGDDDERAIADFSKALELNPNLAVAWNYRGRIHRERGDTEKAMADFNQAIRREPNYAFAYSNRGATQEDDEKALDDYTRAIELNPGLYIAYANRGNRYIYADPDRAIADYTAALAINPAYLPALQYRAIAYANKGDWNKALADCARLISLAPNSPDGYSGRADVYKHMGDLTRAVADYEAAANHGDNYAYLNIGDIYHAKGDYDNAIRYYTWYINRKS